MPVPTKDTTTRPLVNNSLNEKLNFETAITATGYGKFNYFLFLVVIFASCASSFSTTALAYVVPVAECDLALSLVDKGMLNGCYYLGTLGSIFIWGFLADAYGRRKLQMWGQLIDTLCSIGCAFSTSFQMLFAFKVLGGFVGSGPYTILMSYIAELHSSKYRPRVMVYAGIFLAAGNAFLAFIAWVILPMDFSYNITDIYVLNSWRVFLLICSVPSFIAAIGHAILPESPKFLMSSGRNEEALEIFQTMYHWNTGKPMESYPFTTLINEIAEEEYVTVETIKVSNAYPEVTKSKLHSFRAWIKQTKSIFFPPYLTNFILVNLIQIGSMTGANSVRLWIPQLFATIDEYAQLHNNSNHVAMCDILEYSTIRNNITLESVTSETCTVFLVEDIVYIKSIVVCMCAIFGYLFVSYLIYLMGSKKLLVTTFGLCSMFGFGLYWSNNSTVTLVISSIYIMLGGIGIQVCIAVIVELFPTSLRTMVISMTMITGRLGTMAGIVIFPTLMELGCLPTFLFIGGSAFYTTLWISGLRSGLYVGVLKDVLDWNERKIAIDKPLECEPNGRTNSPVNCCGSQFLRRERISQGCSTGLLRRSLRRSFLAKSHFRKILSYT